MAKLRDFLDDYWTTGLERLRDVAEAAATRQGEALMAELVREIMIDATPETIWPFLTEPDRHVEWEGTTAEIDPRPGGVYRVLVAGEYQSAGEYVEVVPKRRWCSPSAGSRRATRSRRARPPSRSRCIPRATRPACASCTAACPTTPSSITAKGGRTTSTASPLRAAGGDPGPGRPARRGRLMDLVKAHDHALEVTEAIVADVRPEQLALPTPCRRVRRAYAARPHDRRQRPLRRGGPGRADRVPSGHGLLRR